MHTLQTDVMIDKYFDYDVYEDHHTPKDGVTLWVVSGEKILRAVPCAGGYRFELEGVRGLSAFYGATHRISVALQIEAKKRKFNT